MSSLEPLQNSSALAHSDATDGSTESSKRPRARSKATSNTFSTTVRSLPWTYLHLTLLESDTSPPERVIDEITAKLYLTSALDQFLGLTGTAIPIDILKVSGQEVYIRVPRDEARAAVESISGWVGVQQGVAWQVKGRSEWLGSLVRGSGQDLFA